MSPVAVIRAKCGAKLLDDKAPGWAGKVNPVQLDIASGDRCVLGQVFGGYSEGCDQLGLRKRDGAGRPYGFDADTDVTFNELDRAWLEEIERRQAPELASA